MKIKTSTLVFIVSFIAMIALAGAASWIYSNPVTVTVVEPPEYSYTLEPETQVVTRYQNATFTATLTVDGVPISGATLYLLKNGAQVASNVTDVNGQCTFSYNMTDPAADYDFKASYFAP